MHETKASHACFDDEFFLKDVDFCSYFFNKIIGNHYVCSIISREVKHFLHNCKDSFEVFFTFDGTIKFLNLLTTIIFDAAKAFNSFSNLF